LFILDVESAASPVEEYEIVLGAVLLLENVILGLAKVTLLPLLACCVSLLTLLACCVSLLTLLACCTSLDDVADGTIA